VRVTTVLRKLLGLCREVVIRGWELDEGDEERRPHLVVRVRTELVADAPRVNCLQHGPTVAAVPWARHDTAFSRASEDLVVHDAIVANKQAAAERHGISWRAVNNACIRVATEARSLRCLRRPSCRC
jgi:hypothetical protein